MNEVEKTKQIRISQSEVSTYNSCEKKHQFAFLNRLEPRQQSEGISRGNAGHKFFEVFLKTQSFEQGLLAAMELDPIMAGNLAPKLKTWVEDIYPTLGWKRIVHVEETFHLVVGNMPTGEEVVFPFTADVIVENTDGQLVIVDHKFIADFYSDVTIQVSKQMPLYIGACRALGIPVHHAQYNFIRTRANAKDLYKQPLVTPTDQAVATLFADQMKRMFQIAERRLEAETKGKVESIRAADPHACKWCPFAPICIEGLNGEVNPLTVKMNYQPNSYGYEDK